MVALLVLTVYREYHHSEFIKDELLLFTWLVCILNVSCIVASRYSLSLNYLLNLATDQRRITTCKIRSVIKCSNVAAVKLPLHETQAESFHAYHTNMAKLLHKDKH